MKAIKSGSKPGSIKLGLVLKGKGTNSTKF